MSEYDKGTHLGYLEYHIEALSDEMDELDEKLAEIRRSSAGDEQYRRERSALLSFRQDVAKRIKKLSEQSEGVMEHTSDDVREVWERQFESAYSTHQEDGADELPDEVGFKRASEHE